MAIGHATSEDGIRWEKDQNNPVLRPTGHPEDFNGLQVAEPGAVVRGGEVYLYFTSVGLRPGGHPPARRVIALARSADASRFGAPKAVLEQGELYPAKLGFDGYSTPAAAIRGGRVHLFYDVGHFDPAAERKWTQVALHHAVSDDGGNRLDRGPEGSLHHPELRLDVARDPIAVADVPGRRPPPVVRRECPGRGIPPRSQADRPHPEVRHRPRDEEGRIR
jgi:hypothetical protein